MYMDKPLYPPVWWNPPKPPEDRCDLRPGEEFTVRFMGYDCDGNALFCLKRRPMTCDCPPRPCHRR